MAHELFILKNNNHDTLGIYANLETAKTELLKFIANAPEQDHHKYRIHVYELDDNEYTSKNMIYTFNCGVITECV